MRAVKLLRLAAFLILFSACGDENGVPPPPNGDGYRCADTICNSSQICAAITLMGGQCEPRPATGCAQGKVAADCQDGSQGCFTRSTTFECKPRPSNCSPVTCGCAVEPLCGSACQ